MKKRVARFLVSKIRPSQEILKIRDGTPLEAEEVMYYRKKEWQGFWFSKLGHLKKFSKFVMVPLSRRKKFEHTEKSPRNGSVWNFSSKFDVPTNVLQKKRVARFLVSKIRPSQEILKIRDGTPLQAEEILTHRKKALEMDRFGTFLASLMSLLMYYRRKEWHGFWFSKLGHLKKFSKFVMVPIRRRKKF
ncbi:hypothetical protein OROMI_013764 [Orobanche minor]